MAEDTHYIQNSFSLGEVSPRMRMRGDLPQYSNACETMRGWRPVPHGGMRTMFGTTYVAEVKNSADAARLIPFIFNNEQTYAVEFGDQYCRFFSQGAVVGAPFEVATPYTDDILPSLRYAQDNDLLYLCHSNHAPRTLTRTGAATFTLDTLAFEGGPFCSLTHPQFSGIGTGITMTASATSGSITLTAGSAFFTPGMAGMLMRLGGLVSTVQGYVTLGAYSTTTSISATVNATLSTTTPGEDWALGAWGGATGYPREVTFFQQRVVFASTVAEPQTFWGTKLGSNTVFTVGTADSDAYTHKVSSDTSNRIVWMRGSANTLLIGTTGEEFSATGENNTALGPNNPLILPESAYGRNGIRPVKAYKGVVYSQRGGYKLNNMTFSLEDDSFASADLLLLSEHLTSSDPIKELHFQLQRDPFIWGVLESGALLSVSWMPKQDISGPAKHTFTNGIVESMCVLPTITSVNDDIWLLVRRTIDGNTVRYVELADENSPLGSNLYGYSISGGRTITGLSHLEGQTVSIVGDGANYNDQVVDSGSVTINDDEADITDAIVGLLTVPTATTIEPEFQTREGSTYGRKKRFAYAQARLLNTGVVEINGEPVDTRTVEDYVGLPPPIAEITDVKVVTRGHDMNGKVTITQPYPFHAHVIGIYGKLTVGD